MPPDGVVMEDGPSTGSGPHQTNGVYQQIFDAFPDGVVLIDRDGCITAANRTQADIYGYGSPEDLIGLDATLLVAPSCRARSARVRQRRLSGENIPPVEYELVRRDGSTFHGETTATVLRGPDGTPSGYICTTRDTTDRKRAEAALGESEERYQDLFNGAGEGMYQVTQDGELLSVNRALAHMLGYDSAADLIGTGEAHLRAWAGPAERSRFKALLDKRGMVGGYECQLVRTDGRKIWVSISTRALSGPSGQPPRYEGFVEDITERKLAVEARRASEVQLELTLRGAVTALGATTELRDPYTSGHQRRVAELAGAIATGLGRDEVRIDLLRIASLLHDIGKIVVPAEILSKPGRLSDAEMQLVRQHPAAGADIVRPIGFDLDVAEIIRQHHERLDGSGYPGGRRGREILWEARILAVADVVEAMISHRPYRPALPVTVAVRELEEGSGRLYEPAVCEVAISLVRDHGFAFSG
jgi:PAS domain S-box-containing protein/putative nucleotidyltransferase with HDIG domain